MRRKVLAVLAAVGLMLGITTPAQAVSNTEMWYYWGGTLPSIRYISVVDLSHNVPGSNYPGTAIGVPVKTSIADWNSYLAVNRVPLRFTLAGTCGATDDCFYVTADYACSSSNNWYGFTQLITWGVWPVANKIRYVDKLVIHECGSKMASISATQRRAVINHEMGHVLGLGHQSGCVYLAPAIPDLMCPLSAPTTRVFPSTYNMRSLIATYGQY